MNKKNYQKIMEDLIRENCTAGEAPSLLLHSCCAPCSSYCIACLAEHFHVTVFYYNPNIYPPEEYHMRAKEQERFIAEFPTKYPVSFVEGMKKIGAILGDNVEIGCGSVLNPGTIIGKDTQVYPLSSVRGCVDSNSIYKNQNEIVEKDLR